MKESDNESLEETDEENEEETKKNSKKSNIWNMICKHISKLHTVKWSNNSIFINLIKHKLTKFNGSKYCYESLRIQLNISHLFTHS